MGKKPRSLPKQNMIKQSYNWQIHEEQSKSLILHMCLEHWQKAVLQHEPLLISNSQAEDYDGFRLAAQFLHGRQPRNYSKRVKSALRNTVITVRHHGKRVGASHLIRQKMLTRSWTGQMEGNADVIGSMAQPSFWPPPRLYFLGLEGKQTASCRSPSKQCGMRAGIKKATHTVGRARWLCIHWYSSNASHTVGGKGQRGGAGPCLKTSVQKTMKASPGLWQDPRAF